MELVITIKKNIFIYSITIVACLVLFTSCSSIDAKNAVKDSTITSNKDEVDETDRPDKNHLNVSTWEEFQALSDSEKEAFIESFKSPEEFEAWMSNVQKESQVCPWENGGKLPDEYTWEEFQALSEEHQEKFFEWFDFAEDFEKWLSEAQQTDAAKTIPWENGGKLPDEYSWEEFQALSEEAQEKFFEWFDFAEDFENWLSEAQKTDEANATPWENGGKQPDTYTWEEFQALSAEHQEMFFEWFESVDDFEEWMNSVIN